MRKFCVVPLAVLLVAVLVLGGCGGGIEQTTATSGSSSTTTSTTTSSGSSSSGSSATTSSSSGEQVEVITIRYADQNAISGWEGQNALTPWVAMVEEACDGRVKFEIYDSQTLTKGSDTWEALRSGIVDIGWCFHGYWGDLTPLADVVTLPFMEFKNAEHASATLWTLYEEYPTIANQFSDNVPLLSWTSEPYFLINNKKEVKTLEDFKGLKVRVTGGPPTTQLDALGASPMNVGMPDTYTNLQKGVMDGMCACWEALVSWRQYETVQYYTYAPFHVVYFTLSASHSFWDGLPVDIQEAIMSCGGLEGSKFWGQKMCDEAVAVGKKMVADEGYEMVEYTVPDDELARWQATAGTPLWEEWVQEMEASGYTEAQEILDRCLELVNEY